MEIYVMFSWSLLSGSVLFLIALFVVILSGLEVSKPILELDLLLIVIAVAMIVVIYLVQGGIVLPLMPIP